VLDQRLRDEDLAVARALLDARALVHLVADRRDLEAPAGHDLAHEERAAPVDSDVHRAVRSVQHADLGHDLVRGACGRRVDRARRLDRHAGGVLAGAELLGEEEGGNAIAGVLADDAAHVRHDLVHGRGDGLDQLEVGGCGEAPGEGARRLEVGEHDRGLAAARVYEAGHPVQHLLVAARDEAQRCGGKARPVEEESAGALSAAVVRAGAQVVDPDGREVTHDEVEVRRPQPGRGRRLDLVEHRVILGVDHLAQRLDAAGCVVRHVGEVGEPPAVLVLLRERVLPAVVTARCGHVLAEPQPVLVLYADDVAESRGHVEEPPVRVAHLRRPARALELLGDVRQRTTFRDEGGPLEGSVGGARHSEYLRQATPPARRAGAV
jgi:hypothetical protein